MPHDLKKLRALDSCTVSNAIERLDVRLRNEGFCVNAVECRFPQLPPMVGYAATARIRTATPPMTGQRCYYDRMDWWHFVASLPEPRVMVLEDVDRTPGVGAFVGEIHAQIGMALKCVGCVTNGAVRDLGPVEALGFHFFFGERFCFAFLCAHRRFRRGGGDRGTENSTRGFAAWRPSRRSYDSGSNCRGGAGDRVQTFGGRTGADSLREVGGIFAGGIG